METYNDIRQQIAGAFGARRPTMLGVVKDVDTTARTCTVEDDGVEYYDVRLQSVAEGNGGVLLVPATGAHVLAARIEQSEEWMIIGCDRITSLQFKAGEKELSFDREGFVFNSGSLGLVKIDKLIDWMGKVYADLVSLGTELKALGVPFVPTTPVPVRTELEDTTVKH